MQFDWTLSVANLLTYLGVVVIVVWRASQRLDKLESKIEDHDRRLESHDQRIDKQDNRYGEAFERVSSLAGELQRLIGRSEFYFGTRKENR
jgi:chromosome segregation ATPase